MQRSFGGPTKEKQKNETGRHWRIVHCDRLAEHTGQVRPTERAGSSPSAHEQNHDHQDQHYRSSNRCSEDDCCFVQLSCKTSKPHVREMFEKQSPGTISTVVRFRTFGRRLKLFLPAGDSRPTVAAKGLNLDQVGRVWSQIVNLNRVLLQFEHNIGRHVMFVILGGKKVSVNTSSVSAEDSWFILLINGITGAHLVLSV